MTEIILLIFDALLKVEKQVHFRPGRYFVSYIDTHVCAWFFLSAAKTSCLLYMAKSLWLCGIDSLMYKPMFS